MIRRVMLLVLMIFGMIVPFIPTDSADAAVFPRARWQGYFTGIQDTSGDDVLGGGIYPVAAPTLVDNFINQIRGHLLGPAGRNQTGAAFIILTMLNRPVGTPMAQSVTDFAEWETRVRYYEANGWVNWFGSQAFVENTYWQGNNGGGSNPNDVAWYTDSGADPAITFLNPVTGNFYVIRKVCANPIGILGGLDTPDYTMQLSATAQTSEGPGPVYPVAAGRSYSVGLDLRNNGPSTSEPGTLQAMLPAGVCAPSAACPLSQTAFIGYSTAQSYRATSAGPPFPAGGNWFWNLNPVPPGVNTAASFAFTPTGAPGTTFSFNFYYHKANRAGAVATFTLNYRIVSERAPGVTGTNSDIHAGGGLCGQAPSSGSVTTSPSGASVAQYVISSSGTISNIRSNNAPNSTTDSLKLGANGGYAQVCRQDLMSAVNAEYPLAGSNCFPASCAAVGTQTVTLTGNEQGVYYFNGAHLNLQGTVGSGSTTRPLTIIARFGDVTINGTGLRLTNALRLPHETPSLGIISSGDIMIDPGVTQVDAYLYSSGGTIITCNGPVAACATPTLRVNGFLMARNILFGRTGAFNSNGPVIAEAIAFTPQIYLNPPKYFDAGIDEILLEGQGERPPLY